MATCFEGHWPRNERVGGEGVGSERSFEVKQIVSDGKTRFFWCRKVAKKRKNHTCTEVVEGKRVTERANGARGREARAARGALPVPPKALDDKTKCSRLPRHIVGHQCAQAHCRGARAIRARAGAHAEARQRGCSPHDLSILRPK